AEKKYQDEQRNFFHEFLLWGMFREGRLPGARQTVHHAILRWRMAFFCPTSTSFQIKSVVLSPSRNFPSNPRAAKISGPVRKRFLKEVRLLSGKSWPKFWGSTS